MGLVGLVTFIDHLLLCPLLLLVLLLLDKT